MTKKNDGTWRPCGDYRRLNLITEPDHYPMPNNADLTACIGQARIFPKWTSSEDISMCRYILKHPENDHYNAVR